jgi:hypothetical protein
MDAGKFKAKISDYGLKETKEGKPYIAVWFAVEGSGDVSWNGYMSEKAIERTLKTLAICGLKGPLEAIADGPLGRALDQTVEVEIEVELKPGLKDPTKKFPQVKWVNAVRGAKFDAAVSASAKAKLAQYSGNWAKIRGEMGIKREPSVGF